MTTITNYGDRSLNRVASETFKIKKVATEAYCQLLGTKLPTDDSAREQGADFCPVAWGYHSASVTMEYLEFCLGWRAATYSALTKSVNAALNFCGCS